jgi:hypothetical protein
MTREQLLGFMRGHRYAVEASVAPSGGPQAAVVGLVVSDGVERQPEIIELDARPLAGMGDVTP